MSEGQSASNAKEPRHRGSLNTAEVLLAELKGLQFRFAPERESGGAEPSKDEPRADDPAVERLARVKDRITKKDIAPNDRAEYKADVIGEAYAELQRRDLAALCLSGGGIRSATFALGVLEALAQADVLGKFHYLSTVSGGGYIGSWLSAWINRSGYPEVQRKLKEPRKPMPDREPEPVHAIRADSNYLTPKLGLASADTWTGIALYVRNLLMNWAVIGTFILAAVMLPRIAAGLLGIALDHATVGWLLLIVAPILLLQAWRIITANRPTWGRENIDQGGFLAGDLVPFFLASIAWLFMLRSGIIDPEIPWIICPYIGNRANFFSLLGISGALIAVGGWVLGGCPLISPASGETAKRKIWDGFATAFAGAIFGVLLAAGSLLQKKLANDYSDPRMAAVVGLIFGPLWILQAQVIGEAFLVGLRSAAERGTDDREWLARSAGWYGAAGITWAIFCGLVLAGPYLAATLGAKLLASTGGVSGLVTTLLGKSSLSKVKPTARVLPVNVILAIAAPIFAVCLIVGLSWLSGWMLHGSGAEETISIDFCGAPWLAIFWTIALAALGSIVSYFVNINRFSLHSVYRNRLIRAYLGASNLDREKHSTLNRFTGFDSTDNLCMSKLWVPNASDDNRRFLHIVNMALNVVSTRNLAWQERKAEPFTVTTLHAGSDRVGFRNTIAYANDLSLGTAMAISGAAASPNMGYHSSPPVTFLLALFNVRLGWWLGNPGPEGSRRLLGGKAAFELDGPKLSAWWLTQELLGLTTDDRAFVYLSDGGHFENLGLYEMVRRRCRFIVVSDAGCDPDFAFEDLGNAVRKIRIDLGIEISFAGLEALRKCRRPPADEKKCCPPPADPAAASEPPVYWAIGTIKYPEEKPEGGCYSGYILYLKPGLREHDDEPADVRTYARSSAAFPHESTADQWFSESQFESYRALGQHIASRAIEAIKKGAATPLGGFLAPQI